MTPKTKKILAGALLAGALVAWAPQLVSAGGDQPPPAKITDALTGATGATSPAEAEPAADPPAGSEDGAPADASGGADAEPADALDRRLGAVQALLPERSRRDLDVLAAAWALDIEERESGERGARDAASGGPAADASAPDATATSRAGEEPTEAPADPFETFLASHPLRGVLAGDDVRLANLGALVVRPGDELGGGVRVAEIGTRWVVLEHAGRRVRVDLAPITPRAAAAASGGTGNAPSSGVAPSTPDASPTTAPGASAGSSTTAPAGPSAAELTELLNGLQKALGTAPAADPTKEKKP